MEQSKHLIWNKNGDFLGLVSEATAIQYRDDPNEYTVIPEAQAKAAPETAAERDRLRALVGEVTND